MSDEKTAERADKFGITEVFATHLELALINMHPLQAFEAAQHATRAYLNSYEFVHSSYKGSPTVPVYSMVPKRGKGGEKM